MIRLARRLMMHKYEPNSNGWFGEWLKDVLGKKSDSEENKESEYEVEGGEESKSASESESGSGSGSSSDEGGGIKIPIPEIPTRIFIKKYRD
ncbi:hypothetical protein SteCoe_30973 [Stentor coeruleus]|uniref:Uncharacterized protein n=1 Tax=Stentor coeruleus TaxID=5963 RepID=A0A1R2B2G7_9CILI|nr:hypothetical protein SteCoe_30973 [Stentor coeruleus]